MQLSKKEFSSESKKIVWRRLVKLLTKADVETDTEIALIALLSPTERMVMAKRLMAAYLLMTGWSVYGVAEHLKMSPPTVYKMKDSLSRDADFKGLLTKYLSSDDKNESDLRSDQASVAEKIEDLWGRNRAG